MLHHIGSIAINLSDIIRIRNSLEFATILHDQKAEFTGIRNGQIAVGGFIAFNPHRHPKIMKLREFTNILNAPIIVVNLKCAEWPFSVSHFPIFQV